MNALVRRPAWPLPCLALVLLLNACTDADDTRPTALQAAQLPRPQELAIARGKIEIEGGLLEILPAQEGRVERVAVREGDRVHLGQELLRLNPEEARQDIAQAQAQWHLAKAHEAAQAVRLPTAQKLVQRTTAAVRAGALDPQRAEDAQQAERDIRSALAIAQAQVALAQQKLNQSQQALRRLTLTAPIEAKVTKLQVQIGTRVSPQMGRPMLVLLPLKPLIVRAELNQSYVARIQPGTRATVVTDSDGSPTDKPLLLRARVLRVGETYGNSRLNDDSSARSNLRVVDCFLQFDSPPTGLRLGQDVRVSFYE